MPYDSAQLPGEGDLTWSGWFRYGASQGNQVLFWLGGMGGTAPQLWLRGEPSANRLIATITTPNGSKSVTTTQSYADQAWHHVALRRTGGQLTVWVDGTQAASGPDSPGSVSRTVSFQLWLGQRLDGGMSLKGGLDDVRLYRRALTDAELERVRLWNAPVRDGLVLHLPFDRLR